MTLEQRAAKVAAEYSVGHLTDAIQRELEAVIREAARASTTWNEALQIPSPEKLEDFVLWHYFVLWHFGLAPQDDALRPSCSCHQGSICTDACRKFAAHHSGCSQDDAGEDRRG